MAFQCHCFANLGNKGGEIPQYEILTVWEETKCAKVGVALSRKSGCRLTKGMEQGIQKGIQTGKVQGLRHSIAIILGNRFETVPQSLTQQIQQIENLETLEILLGMALRVESLDEFKKKLQAILEA